MNINDLSRPEYLQLPEYLVDSPPVRGQGTKLPTRIVIDSSEVSSALSIVGGSEAQPSRFPFLVSRQCFRRYLISDSDADYSLPADLYPSDGLAK